MHERKLARAQQESDQLMAQIREKYGKDPWPRPQTAVARPVVGNL
jgi:hypothetical protein